MAIESARGCGFRQVGGLYLVGDGDGVPCCRLPLPLTVCPCCGGGIKPSRGFTWIEPSSLFHDAPACKADDNALTRKVFPSLCQLREFRDMERAGLIWIGGEFYPDPDAFNREASDMGISRRIASVPRGFEVGKTWVFLAHRKAIQATNADGETEYTPAVFRLFKPERIELIVRESELTDDYRDKLAKRGITPVAVPDNDPDHNRRPRERKFVDDERSGVLFH